MTNLLLSKGASFYRNDGTPDLTLFDMAVLRDKSVAGVICDKWHKDKIEGVLTVNCKLPKIVPLRKGRYRVIYE